MTTFFKFILVMAFLAMAPAVTGAAAASSDEASRQIVRVCIIDNKESVSLSLKGRYAISDEASGAIIDEGPYLTAKVTAAARGLAFGPKQTTSSSAVVTVQRDGNIYLEGRRFRGSVDIVKKPDGRIMVINRLPMDEYLYGVLYHEVSHRWPMEAIKAQSIAARTFALYQVRQSRNQPYDLRSDIYSQVYGGRTSEKWSTNAAVDRTRGQVLTYAGEIFPAYYHATCAGVTEDAGNLWNVKLPPLKGGVRCGYCILSPHYRWIKIIPVSLLEEKLNDAGYKVGKIAGVSVVSRNSSGRVEKVDVTSRSGETLPVAGKDFRQLLGPNNVRSAKFTLSVKWPDIVIEGMGWGHGVGMCQWGAYGMSCAGRKAADILKFYYPGSEITSI